MRALLLAAAVAALTIPPVAAENAKLRDPAWLVALGERMERQGEVLGAMLAYERALQVDPANSAALRAAGANAVKRADSEEAARHYSAWANAEPRNPEALLGLGSSLVVQRKPREALAVLQRAADLGGPKGLIAAQRGLALDLDGDMRGAQAAYAEALEANPLDPVTTQRMALSLAMAGDGGAALHLMQRFGKEPEAAEIRRTLALIHALGSRQDNAAEIAASIMPLNEARQMQAFYTQLPRLAPRDRAAAVHFGGPAQPSVGAPEPAVQVAAVAPPPRPLPSAGTGPRIWVQLSSLSDASRLPSEWRRIRQQAGGAIDGRSAYVEQAGPVNRLLVGPFRSLWSARQLIAVLKARRVDSVVNRTPAGVNPAPLA